MMERIKLLIMAGMLLVGISSIVLPVGTAAADTPSTVVCQTIGSNNNCGTTPPHSLDINKVIGAVVNILSEIIGIASVIMIVYGGFKYITAAGDSSKITSARNTIVYALVGVAIAVMAQALVRFVLHKATS